MARIFFAAFQKALPQQFASRESALIRGHERQAEIAVEKKAEEEKVAEKEPSEGPGQADRGESSAPQPHEGDFERHA